MKATSYYAFKRLCHWVLPLLAGCAMFSSPDAKRGDQHLAAGNWEEASLAYKQALKDDPFDSSLQNKYAIARERAAAMHDERGRELLKKRQLDLAIEEFKRALTIEPSSSDHQDGLREALRLKDARDQYREAERLAQLGRASEALEGFARAAELDPALKEALEAVSKITEEQQALNRDDRQKQPVTLQFRNAGLKEVLEALGKAAKINFVFDKDVRNDPFSVSLQDKPFDEALNLILNSNSLFAQRASPDLIIISPNTKQKQEQYQDLMIRTFYLSNAKAKDMLALLKTMLDAKHIHANEQLNTIVIRDQPEKVELAEKIILANDREDSEVLFDVEVLEVDRTVDQTYGLSYPKQVAAAMVPPGFTGLVAGDIAQQFTIRQLTSLGPDSYVVKLPTNVQLDFFKQVTDAKTLAAPKVRVVNNKKAEINIGDKQPILLVHDKCAPGTSCNRRSSHDLDGDVHRIPGYGCQTDRRAHHPSGKRTLVEDEDRGHSSRRYRPSAGLAPYYTIQIRESLSRDHAECERRGNDCVGRVAARRRSSHEGHDSLDRRHPDIGRLDQFLQDEPSDHGSYPDHHAPRRSTDAAAGPSDPGVLVGHRIGLCDIPALPESCQENLCHHGTFFGNRCACGGVS